MADDNQAPSSSASTSGTTTMIINLPGHSSSDAAALPPIPGPGSEEHQRAINLFVQGKRSLLIHDYKSAVASLEEACQIFDQVYGVSADENGDAYLQYGIALFELARLESGVLDGLVNPIKESDDEDDDEDEEGDEEEGEGEDGENEDGKASSAEHDSQQDSDNANDGEADGKAAESEEDLTAAEVKSDEPAAGSSSAAAAEPVAGPSSGGSAANGGGAETEEEENEPSNAEVAWEVLGLARDVFRRQIDKGAEYKLKLAEALQTLAEISLEWENNEAALDLFQECLSLRKEVLPDDHRAIAETYYHIGITFSFLKDCEKANDCFRSAMNVIESKIKNLKAAVALTPADEQSVERERKVREIEELEQLLPEMALKIEDSRDQMNNENAVAQAVADEDSKEQEVIQRIKESPSKPVNNISHLVKRKRDLEASVDVSLPVVKKLCSEAGDGIENGSSGHSSSANGAAQAASQLAPSGDDVAEPSKEQPAA